MVDVRILNQHADYWVLIAELNDPALTVVVKIAGENAPLAHDFERTAMLHPLVAVQTRIPKAKKLLPELNVAWRVQTARKLHAEWKSTEAWRLLPIIFISSLGVFVSLLAGVL